MINSEYAIWSIWHELEVYFQKLGLPNEMYPSDEGESIYVYVKDKHIRGSNHHGHMSNMKDRGKEPWFTDNLTIEFTEPRYYEDKFNPDGTPKMKRNRHHKSVRQEENGRVKPYSSLIVEYTSANLNQEDIPNICESVLYFIKTGVYYDPYEEDELKHAEVYTIDANIKPHISKENNVVDEGVCTTRLKYKKILQEMLGFNKEDLHILHIIQV